MERNMELKEVRLGDLKTGDQIAVREDIRNLHPSLAALTVYIGDMCTYFHHGIYIKEDCSVIEFHGDNKANARPKQRDFTEFFAGHDTLYRVEYEDGECLPVNETMQRAYKALELGNRWPKFNLIENNCESFATLLKTGFAASRQVLEVLTSSIKTASIVGAAAAAVGSLGFGVSGNRRK